MRASTLFLVVTLLVASLGAAESQAQQVKRPTGTKKAANGYHRTQNTKARARAGAYARYDRSGRRDEENLKLAPGLRLNMPSPPTTDYMGRPLKKKAPKTTLTSSTSMSSEKVTTVPAAASKTKTKKK